MQAKWRMTAGMAVELLPGAIIASLPHQANMQSLQHNSCSGSCPAVSLHSLRHAAARAAGWLLLSEVLAAEAEGVPLPEDLPQLFTDAVTHTVLPAAGSSSSSSSVNAGQFLWQHAAVLACSCSRLVRELQMSNSLSEAFDVAARQVSMATPANHTTSMLGHNSCCCLNGSRF
jgi:hypothetical protein